MANNGAFPLINLSLSQPSIDKGKGQQNGNGLYLGLTLSALSALFIGCSFILKKKSLIALGNSGGIRAGFGGHGYLRHWLWWAGLFTMAFGEALNFIAYTFAPATLVTPLGGLSVIVTAILSSIFLEEALNLLGKIGCGLCVIGSTMIVIHSPKEAEVTNIEELTQKLVQPEFMCYVLIVLTGALILIYHFSPRYGSRYVIIYISICSLMGGFSVLACKTLGLAIKDTINGSNEFSSKITWFSLGCLVSCVTIQMNYLNKALDTYSTSVVTPIYYVLFTICVILASAVLFKEWEGLDPKDMLGIISGFLTVICAIFLLHAFRDVDISCYGMAAILGQSQFIDSRRTSGSSSPFCRSPLLIEDLDGRKLLL